MLHGYNVTRDLKLYMDTVMSKKNEKKNCTWLKIKEDGVYTCMRA